MLRRLTVFLRRGLFAVGVVLLVTIPVTFVHHLTVLVPSGPEGNAIVMVFAYGSVYVVSVVAPTSPWVVEIGDVSTTIAFPVLAALCPAVHSLTPLDVYIPLYLLAVICLAWPVTSFFLHRRRQGRGFAVETVEGMNAEG